MSSPFGQFLVPLAFGGCRSLKSPSPPKIRQRSSSSTTSPSVTATRLLRVVRSLFTTQASPGRPVSNLTPHGTVWSPFQFGLGQSQVIQGWDEGVQGMKVGGRRRLTIPPHMGYGAAGAGGVIAGNETLVFVVDLLGVG